METSQQPLGKLVVARHHESEWNKIGLWQGQRDIRLTQYGFERSEEMGRKIKDIHVDQAYASMLVRSIETLASMLNVMEQYRVPTEHASALNERDYGDYNGKNKWEVKKEIGDEAFQSLRRGWDYPVPNGETLKMVYERALPYYLGTILPVLKQGKNVLLVAHGNSIRALRKYIESIPEDKVGELEMPLGTIFIYELDADGRMVGKEIREVETAVPNA